MTAMTYNQNMMIPSCGTPNTSCGPQNHATSPTTSTTSSSAIGISNTETNLPLQTSFDPTSLSHKASLVVPAVNSSGGTSTDNDNNNSTNKNGNNAVLIPPNETGAACDGTIRVPSGSGYRIMTPFPWRLHEMLEELEFKNMGWIVSWLPGGRAFQVHSPEKFADDIIPKYFRHTRYKSFQRQLYLYGFRSLEVSSLSRGAYFHPFFVKDNRSLCRFIERPKSTSNKGLSGSSTECSTRPENKRKRSIKKQKKSDDTLLSTSCSSSSASSGGSITKEQQLMSSENERDSISLYSMSGLPLPLGQASCSKEVIKCSDSLMTQLEPLTASSSLWSMYNPNLDGSVTPDLYSEDEATLGTSNKMNGNHDSSMSLDHFDWDGLNVITPPVSTSVKKRNCNALLQQLEPFSDDIISLFGSRQTASSFYVPQTIG